MKSRETGFFYGHPQNRFWRIVSELYQSPCPKTIEEKRNFLLSNHIAVWDVIGSCEITGSSDSSIKSVKVNDLRTILDNAPIERIFLNGKTAQRYYLKYTEPIIHREALVLPSTSPANASWSYEKLLDAWRVILG